VEPVGPEGPVEPVAPLGIPSAKEIVLELYDTVGVEPAGNAETETSNPVVKSIVLCAEAAAAAALLAAAVAAFTAACASLAASAVASPGPPGPRYIAI
jgi:hypothetical protein